MKNFVIFDLEATCEDKAVQPIFDNEIIEIGAVKTDSEGNVIGTFDIYVKPVRTEVTDFCTKLTGITKDKIDSEGVTLKEALEEFEKFIGEDSLLSWGHYDKKQMKKDMFLNGLTNFENLLKGHRSLKHDYADIYKTRPMGMAKALNKHNLKLEGTHHNGLDDALNLAKILKVMIQEKKYV